MALVAPALPGRVSFRQLAVRDFPDDVFCAPVVAGADAEAGAVAGFVRNVAGDAVFAERAGQVFRHRFFFSGPDFASGVLGIPIVGESLSRIQMIVCLRRKHSGSAFLSRDPFQRTCGAIQIRRANTDFKARRGFQIIGAGRKKAAGGVVHLRVPELDFLVAQAVSGVDPKWIMMAPVYAVEKLLEKTGWDRDRDVDLVELNEAFAAAAIAITRELRLDPAKVNVNGGAVAIGHPIGASGARILTTLLYEMQRRNVRRGIAALCLGGGNAVAMAVERV